MCLIVDANRASLVFAQLPSPDFVPIRNWLTFPKKDGQLIVGGRLEAELNKINGARRFILALQRAGRARFISLSQVIAEEATVVAMGSCQSNDSRVIALARVSGARVLCSEDGALWTDFKNQRLINNPRGRIYRTAQHARLLCHTKACRQKVAVL
jgi:hypothetical protein